jgi:hypothetical protein
MPANLKLSGEAINKLLNGPDGPVAKELIRRGTRAQDAARRELHSDWIRRRMVKRGPIKDAHGLVIYITVSGTGPHEIRGAPLLVWENERGEVVFARKVNHRGSRFDRPGGKVGEALKAGLRAAVD